MHRAETITPTTTLMGMSIVRSTAVFVGIGLVGLLTLTACASSPGAAAPTGGTTPDGGVSLGDARPAPPTGEVIGMGTVMDVDGVVELCMGAIAESYPPQCSGLPLKNWRWDGRDDKDQSGDTIWGAYAVTGTFDGDALNATQEPISLALYDPMPLPDPTDGAQGATSEARLLAIQQQLPQLLGDDSTLYFGSGTERGYLWVDVLWDDGTLQQAADADFGADVVVIRSALRSLG